MLGVQAAPGKQIHGGGSVIHPSEVSAVLVTRGNVDMTEITDSITAAGIEDIVLWDNSKREQDLSCYGRYAGIAEAKNEYIFHQDDDLVTNVPGLLDAYDPVRSQPSGSCSTVTWRTVSTSTPTCTGSTASSSGSVMSCSRTNTRTGVWCSATRTCRGIPTGDPPCTSRTATWLSASRPVSARYRCLVR